MEDYGDVHILHINNVTHQDAGPIRCIATLAGKEKSRHSFEDTVGEWSSSSSAQLVRRISCTAELTVVPDINFLGSDQTDRLSDQVFSDSDPVSMDGSSVDVSDDNMKELYVSGLDEPSMIVRGPQDTTALVGDRVLLKATYIGHPEPTVRWTRAVSYFFFFIF